MDKTQETKLESIFQKTVAGGDNIIAVLQELQNEFGYVQEEAVTWIARRANIPLAKFYGVLTFYSQFHQTPRGKNVITVCSGTVCHVKGAQRVISKMRDDLNLKGDEATTGDGLFTLENVNCVGACSIAPVVIINGKVFGKATADKMVRNLNSYKE